MKCFKMLAKRWEDDADINIGEVRGTALDRTGAEKRERLKEKLIEEGIIF